MKQVCNLSLRSEDESNANKAGFFGETCFVASVYLNVAQNKMKRCWGPLIVLATVVTLLWLTGRAAAAQSCPPYAAPRERFGFNMTREGGNPIEAYDIPSLNAHWYLDYAMDANPWRPDGMAFAQMVRPPAWKRATFTQTAESALQANPGALWIVGNEPDRDKQDGLTAADYAIFYHDVYTFLKARDPGSRIAIAAVVEPTPLRRRYLDLVLTEYQQRYGSAMPIDVWTVHAFILPENTQWGAYIPIGLEAYAHEGMQYTIEDHDNQGIFQNNLIAFRQWMAERGYRDRPLIITEYGILLSPLHGFPYERVSAFMLASFNFLLNAADSATGYPADNNRLVQTWSWFSLNYPPYDVQTGLGLNGNLFEPASAQRLPLGEDFAGYIASLDNSQQIKLNFEQLQVEPTQVVLTPTVTASGLITAPVALTFTVSVQLVNQGVGAVCNLTLLLQHQAPNGAILWREQRLLSEGLAAAGQPGASQPLQFQWQATSLALGVHMLKVSAVADHNSTGLSATRSEIHYPVWVSSTPISSIYLPGIFMTR